MQTPVAINQENFLPVKKARLIIAVAITIYLIIGTVIGYMFVWYPFQSKSRYEAEIQDALKSVQQNPNDISARIDLGFKYMKAQKYDQAKGEYNAALQIDPNNTTTQLNLAYLDIEIKNYKEADKILSKLIQSEPGFQASFLLGKSEFLQNKYSDAVQNLTSARDMDPTDTETLYYLGVSYARLGQKDNASKAFKSALDFDPNRQDVQKELTKLGVK